MFVTTRIFFNAFLTKIFELKVVIVKFLIDPPPKTSKSQTV